MKKRADTLAEYIVGRVERLERENRCLREENEELFKRGKQHYLTLREWEMPCAKVLENIKRIEKDKAGVIVIEYKDKHNEGFDPRYPAYPLIEKLLKEYEKKVEFERIVKEYKEKGGGIRPIAPLMKGE
jgi:uncharacterized protein (UPF0335 family)